MSGTLNVFVDQIRDNIIKIKSQTKAKFCAVVKANAYGVGIRLAKYICDIVDYFAVANVLEANALAKYSGKPILVLSPPSIEDIKKIKYKNIEFAVDRVEIVEELKRQKERFKIHVAINSGMNRYGANFDEFLKIVESAKKSENICMRGVFSHFYNSDFLTMEKQHKIATKFFDVARANFNDVLCHISNSGGLMFAEDMVRVGIGLYFNENKCALSLESKICEIRKIQPGDIVSYNAHFEAKSKKTIAVVPLGYADGINRKLSGCSVIVKGQECKIVGDICMDCFMIDVTGVDVSVGERVTIFGKNGKRYNSVCNLAKWCDTICYEILTGISCRVKRKYNANYHRKIQGKKTGERSDRPNKTNTSENKRQHV